MRRALLRLLALAVAVLALGVPVRADDANTIRVLEVPIDLYAGGYFAQDQGFFKAAGLNVEITTLANGGAVATALAGGSGDVAATNLVSIGTAFERGVPLTVIAGGGLYSSRAATTVVCVSKTSTLRTARDLEGKTVSVAALNDLATLGLKKWLTQNGADYKKVRFLELGYPAAIAGLADGRIDAAMLTEPWQTVARDAGDRVYAKPEDAIGAEFNIGAWATTRAWAQAHPDLVRRFASAIYAAAKWANAHQDQSALILAKYAKSDPKQIAGMIRAPQATDLTAAHVQPPLDAAYEAGQLEKPLAAAELIWDPGK